jgi:hypothetical protein
VNTTAQTRARAWERFCKWEKQTNEMDAHLFFKCVGAIVFVVVIVIVGFASKHTQVLQKYTAAVDLTVSKRVLFR